MTPRRWGSHAVPILLILVGIAIRLRQYVFGRSLWLDEAMLSVSIAARSPLALLQPLEYNQNSPVLFLWLTKAFTWLFGVNELALRAVPQISGYAVLIALTVAAHRRFGRAAGVVCASLAVLSPSLIRYANVVKPYGSDALATSFLILAYFSWAEDFSRNRALLMSGLATFCVLLSNPSVFAVAAIWIALLWTNRLNPEALRRVALSALPPAAIFVLLYLTVVGRAAGNELVRAGYSTAFLPPAAPSTAFLPMMIAGTFLPAFAGNGSTAPDINARRAAVVVALFVVAVIVATWRRRGGLAIVLCGPAALAFAAAALGLYPVGVPRLMVFHVPCVILTAAGATARLWPRAAPRRLNLLGLALWMALLWPLWAGAREGWIRPFRGDDFRGAYKEYASIQHGEPVYVAARAQPAWVFYSTNWNPAGLDQREFFEARSAFYFAAGGAGESFENRVSRGRKVLSEEGRDLVFDFHGRLEILGISSGRHWKWPMYVSGIDQGWPEHEAARLIAAAKKAGTPCQWVVFEQLWEQTYDPLLSALRVGYQARIRRQIAFPEVMISQVCQ